jgi:AraC family transcriptional regulator
MDGHERGVVGACLETPEFRRDMFGSIAQHPSTLDDADLHHDRDHWITIDTILDMVGGRVPDGLVYQPPGTTAIGMFSRVSPGVPNPSPQGNLVTALSLAVNDALSGSPRRLERFLPSDPTIEQLLQARGAANQMATEPARLYLRFLYSAILTWVAAGKTITWPVQQRPLTPLPKWRFARVREYIDLHIEEPIRLQDLAKVAGLSRMHFAAQFRAYTGISPCKFVTMQRMQHAQLLLGDPRRTVADVAFGVGFRTQAHFTTVFHRFVGSTPNCWRRALSRENTKMTP